MSFGGNSNQPKTAKYLAYLTSEGYDIKPDETNTNLGNKLGSGTYGDVFLVRDAKTKELLAAKYVKNDDTSAKKGFKKEGGNFVPFL